MSRTMNVLLLACSLVGVTTIAHAKNVEADMTFHGTLITPPPCTIENNKEIGVNFGNRVGINKVDGVFYRKKMAYMIICEDAGRGNWAMKLNLIGIAAEFDKEALETNKTNLGIRIYQNDKPFTPNSILEIDPAHPPLLEAVPVKNAGATLTTGPFEAWATLRADYQ